MSNILDTVGTTLLAPIFVPITFVIYILWGIKERQAAHDEGFKKAMDMINKPFPDEQNK